MSDLIKDFQKQNPGSELVELYEIEKPNGSYAYITSGEDSDGSSLQMYDYSSNSTLRTYSPSPIISTGFEIKIDGAIARPNFSVGNANGSFSTLMGTSDYDLLVGKNFIRRLTLKKYLQGESGDPGSGSTPIEFPRQVWTISRIVDRNKATITFELAAPFDLQGIKIPARQIVSNACPWEYQGASGDLAESAKCGGCTWSREGSFIPKNYMPDGTLPEGTTHTVYVTIDDEYIVPASGTFTDYTAAAGSTSFSIGNYITTDGTATRVASDGSTSSQSITEYWIVNTAGTKTALGTPSDSNAKFDRVRVHQGSWASGTTYYTYTDDKLNDIVQYTSNGLTFVWKVTQTNSGNTPGFNSYWERADQCGKTLTSCGKRFGYYPDDITSTSSRPQAGVNTNVVLPFGAFPGSKNFK